MSAPNARTPLTADGIDILENSSSSKSVAKLSALVERLGFRSDTMSSSRKGNASTKNVSRREESAITVSHDELEDLLTALENTRDMIRQLYMTSAEIRSMRRRHHRIPKIITNNLLILTIFWQVLNIAIVTVMEAFKKNTGTVYLSSVSVLVVFQAINLVLVLFTTVKLTKQISHQTVTKSFLGQSFLSTTLLYAGLYTLIHKIDADGFVHMQAVVNSPESPSSTPLVYLMMVFYSVSTATLCGSSLIVPVVWTAQLTSSTQMLMSYVYFASVLYMAVHPNKTESKWKVVRESSASTSGSSGVYGSLDESLVV